MSDDTMMPARILVNKSLPVSRDKQSAKLSIQEYQSIAESAVLSASLLQSRIQWLYSGIFDKYWTKPLKRKGVNQEPPNNPDAKTMQKLGGATVIIEPHTFEVLFYTVRDLAAPTVYQRPPTQQMAPPPSSSPYPTYSPQTPYQQQHVPVPANAPQTPGTQQPASGNVTTPASGPTGTQATPAPTSASTKPPAVPSAQQKPTTSTPVRGSTQDPVIQMLAARAASDPQLKELMKIVATSQATTDQLKEFQAHIDEFNEVIRKQDAERAAKAGQPQAAHLSQPASTAPSHPTTPSNVARPGTTASAGPSTLQVPQHGIPQRQPAAGLGLTAAPPTSALPGTMHTIPQPAGTFIKGVPLQAHGGYSQQPVRVEPPIKHIVMEITSVVSGSLGACADRWLFPEHAVLEMRPGGLDMICSFLIERKGSAILASIKPDQANDAETRKKWKADQGYYQPVTMTIRALNHKTIETIAKAAKTLPAVQEHMREVMNKKQRAPAEFLMHQLARDKVLSVPEKPDDFVDSGVELGTGSDAEDDELKDFYGI
jgi:hypothetical protein